MVELHNDSFEYKYIKYTFEATKNKSVAPGGAGPGIRFEVKKIEKVYNKSTFESFTLEVRKMLRKYPERSIWDLLKLMYNGSK